MKTLRGLFFARPARKRPGDLKNNDHFYEREQMPEFRVFGPGVFSYN
jgi:hypothetical protein